MNNLTDGFSKILIQYWEDTTKFAQGFLYLDLRYNIRGAAKKFRDSAKNTDLQMGVVGGGGVKNS